MKNIRFPNTNKTYLLFLIVWFLINIFQALSTSLHFDEAYYWMYSQSPAWGYFDHPPMVAWLTRIGYVLFKNELGVRLFHILLSTGTMALVLIWYKDSKFPLLPIILLLSIPLTHTHIGGFMALPDTPLAFFSILFFIGYQRFYEKPGLIVSLLMAVAVAGMIYSKYHALLVIGLTVLSNLRLLRNKYFWLTVIVTGLLLIPHIHWQFINDFPSVKYHLISRSKPWGFKYVFQYIATQYVVLGPVSAFILFWQIFAFKPQTLLEKAFKFNIWGFYIFFLFMSFRNRIEGHWTIVIMPMAIYLTYPLLERSLKWRKRFTWLALPAIIFFFIFRIYIAVDAIPNLGKSKCIFYKRDNSVMQIKEMAQGKTVAFFNNYALASMYSFYNNEPCFMFSYPGYRFSQFDLWDNKYLADGKELFTVQLVKNNPDAVMLPDGRKIETGIIQNFRSPSFLKIKEEVVSEKEGEVMIRFNLHNTSQDSVVFDHWPGFDAGIIQKKSMLKCQNISSLTTTKTLLPGQKCEAMLRIKKDELIDDKSLVLFIQTTDKVRGQLKKIVLNKNN